MSARDLSAASPGLCDDLVGGPDTLGLDRQAEPFARLIMDARTRAPLCLGVLGPSGAGKSTFMARLWAMAEALAGEPDQHGDVVRVPFNAWRNAGGQPGAALLARVADAVRRHGAPAKESTTAPAAWTDLDALLAGEGAPGRVVLLVDDLDRCPPAAVVEVLETIHLHLALDRLAVVLAADARWLLRALAVHHHQLLEGADEAYRDAVLYGQLEKVFQLTYALAPMAPAAFARHVERLADPDDEEAPAPAPVDATGVVTVTAPEREFLASLLPLLDTPRAAGRAVNAHRLIKSRAREVPFEDRARPVLLLLALLFGRRRQAEELLRRLHQKEPPFQTPKLQLHMAIKNLAQAEGQEPEVHDGWIELGRLVERLAGDLLVEQCTCEAGEVARHALVTGQICHRW